MEEMVEEGRAHKIAFLETKKVGEEVGMRRAFARSQRKQNQEGYACEPVIVRHLVRLTTMLLYRL